MITIRKFCCAITLLVGVLSIVAPAMAKQSDGVDFFITADKPRADKPVVPINIATTASFTVDLGIKNTHGTEDSVANVKQQSYTVSAGSNGIIDSIISNGTIYTPPGNSNSFTFTIAGGNSQATFGVVATLHYSDPSAADDDKVITMSGTATFNDDTLTNPDQISTKSPNPTVTATAVDIDSINSDATQTNVNQNVTISGTTYGNNWAAVKATSGDITVTVKLKPDTDNAASAITWSGGNAVSNQPRQRTVTKTVSAVTGVTATCGLHHETLYVWIIWGSYEIRLKGSTDAGQLCQQHTTVAILGPPNGAGIWYPGVGGGDICGPIDKYTIPGLTYENAFAVGKTQGICSLTPAGIGKIIAPSAWNMARTVSQHGWYDATAFSAVHNDQSFAYGIDTDPSDVAGADRLYDADFPASVSSTEIITTGEVYDNFVAWATASLGTGDTDICNRVSYYYESQIDLGKTNPIVTNTLATGSVAVPTAPHNWP